MLANKLKIGDTIGVIAPDKALKNKDIKYLENAKMKIVTLCGSLKFQKEMMTVAEKMALDGYCILTPVYPVSENMEKTKEQLIKLKEAHFKRIELSDAILVVNINNYIGESTKLEIDYAKKLGKEILYYSNLI